MKKGGSGYPVESPSTWKLGPKLQYDFTISFGALINIGHGGSV